MINKKGELAVATILAGIIILIGTALLIDLEPKITGFSIAGGPAGANIAACGVVNSNSVLTQSITASVNSTCLNITADDITLDCQGYNIYGNGDGNGIEAVNRNNITLKNCIISGFNSTSNVEKMQGIFFKKTNNSKIINCTTYGNRMGIQIFDNSRYNQILDCNVSNNLQYQGIYIYSSAYYTDINNTIISFNNGKGIRIVTSGNVDVDNNQIYNNSGDGVEFFNSFIDHNLIQNNIYNNNGWGIDIDSTGAFLYNNNTATNNNNGDIKIANSANNHHFLNQVFAGYSFTGSGYSFEDSNEGLLDYTTQAITASGNNLTSEINLGYNLINVNGSKSGLNKSATLHLYNLPWQSTAHFKIIQDTNDDGNFQDCNLCTILGYTGGNLSFNVNHFTKFSTTANTSVSQCRNITHNSNVTQNLNSSGTCLEIIADNITLDCQGHTITGDGTGDGILIKSSRYNVTVKNCIINNFNTGIEVGDTGTSCKILNNTVTNMNYYGIRIDSKSNSTNNQIDGNNLINISNIAIAIKGNNSNITNNNISNAGGSYGNIKLTLGYFNLVKNNYIKDSSYGIYLLREHYTPVLNNTIINSTNAGIQTFGGYDCHNITIKDNTLISNQNGLNISSDDTLIKNNSIINSTQYGIYFDPVWSLTNNIINLTTSQNSGTFDLSVPPNTPTLDIIDSTIGSYKFNSTDLYLENSLYGELEFTSSITAVGSDLIGSSTSEIKINNNSIFVNSSAQPIFNISANLTHYSLQPNQISPFWDPEDDGSFVRCPASVCSNINFNNLTNDLNYLVNRFTTYQGSTNTPPNVTVPTLIPSPVYTNNNLIGNTSYTDFDTDSGTVFFNWTINNAQTRYINYSSIASGNSVTNTLGSGNFSKNQNITLYVWAYDGYNHSITQSNSIVISNTPPGAPTMSLTPASPTSSQDLYCNVTTNSTDLDGDYVNYTYYWYNNSNLFTSFGPTTQLYHIIGFGNTSRNETWNCTVLPFDGQDNGTAASAVVIIQNSLPISVNLLSPVNNANLSDPTPKFNWTNSFDNDNDPFTYYLEISTSSSFASLIINQSTSNTEYTLTQNLSDNNYYWRVKSCDSFGCSSSTENRTFILDTNPPNSTITSLTNNSDIGKNNFPINISGTANDNVGLSYVQVSINGTYYNATGTTNWNYSWTPTTDGEYQIYSRAIDLANNQETQFEVYYLEVYTTSNLTNTIKVNSINLNSDETNSDIRFSIIDLSNLLNFTSYNCTINNSQLNYSQCYNSPSSLVNVTSSGSNFTNANVTNSHVVNSNISDSKVSGSNITSSSIVSGSDVVNSNITNSQVDASNITESSVIDSDVVNSNITDSFIDDSNVTNSYVDDSNITNTNVSDSTIVDSNVTDSTVDDSTIENSTVDDSTVTGSTLTDVNLEGSTVTGSTLTNVTVVNSTITNAVLNNTNITNDICYSGTIVYSGTTYTCSAADPIDLDTIYNPPYVPSGGGGRGPSRIPQCNDKKDNDGDNLIDWPLDPGCTTRYDDNETEAVCKQSWICLSWSQCLDQKQTRICEDLAQCQKYLDQGQVETIVEMPRPLEEQECEIPQPPVILPEVECNLDSDCPENYHCQDNQCVLIPVERKPFTDTLKNIFQSSMSLSQKANQKTFSLFASVLAPIPSLLSSLLSKVSNLLSKVPGLFKYYYSPIIITILSIAVIIAGYFAYKSFMTADYTEALRRRRLEHERIQKQKQREKQREEEKIKRGQERKQRAEVREERDLERAQIEKQRAFQKEKLEELSSQLSSFVQKSLLTGRPISKIRKNLIVMGWPQKIVDRYLDQIYEDNKQAIKQIQKSKIMKQEMQRLRQEIKQPKQGIRYIPKPPFVRKKALLPEEKEFAFKPTPEFKRLQEEMARLEQEIKQPAQNIKFDRKPPFIRTKEVYKEKPVVVKPSAESRFYKAELTQLEEEIKQTKIPSYQKPKVTEPKTSPKTSLDQLRETVSHLAIQGKSKEYVVQSLVKKNWPVDFVNRYIQKYFPHLQSVSLFKKEVADLEQELKKLRKR